MTFTKEQIYDFVYNNLHELSNDSIMEINEDELGNEHVGKMYDFDDYVRGESFLDVYNSLDSNFSAHADFFKYDGEYSTSDDLSDFIDMDEIAEWITDEFTSDSADDYLDEGDCYGLHAIYIPLKEKMNAEEKPKHTEEEIEQKLTEYVNNIDIDDIVSGINALPNAECEYHFIADFAEYMSEHYINADIVTMIVKSSMVGVFKFKDGFFTIDDGSLFSYEEWELRSLFRTKIREIPSDFIERRAPLAKNILDGIWED